MANVTVSYQIETVNLVIDNRDDGRGSESQTPLSPSGGNKDNEGFQQFTGSKNRRRKKGKRKRGSKRKKKKRRRKKQAKRRFPKQEITQ